MRRMRAPGTPPRQPWRHVMEPVVVLVVAALAATGAIVGLTVAIAPPTPIAVVTPLPPADAYRAATMHQARLRAAGLGASMLVFVGRLDASPAATPETTQTQPPPQQQGGGTEQTAPATPPAAPSPTRTKKQQRGNQAPARDPQTAAPSRGEPDAVATDGPDPRLADYLVVDGAGDLSAVARRLPAEYTVVTDTGAVLREGSETPAPSWYVVFWALVLVAIGTALRPREYWRRTVHQFGARGRAPVPPPGDGPGDRPPAAPGRSEPLAQPPQRPEPQFRPEERVSGQQVLFRHAGPEVSAGRPWPRQCPRCGGFRLPADGPEHRCDDCLHRWHVYPGEAWPAVVVAPRRPQHP